MPSRFDIPKAPDVFTPSLISGECQFGSASSVAVGNVARSTPADTKVKDGDVVLPKQAPYDDSDPSSTMILVCSYTDNEILAHIPKGAPGEGIYAWRLDGATGKLSMSPTAVSAVRPNPAFLLPHPALDDVFYCSTECIHAEGCGEVVTLKMDKSSGSLTEVTRAGAGGRSTCYLNLLPCRSLLAVVNYWDAILSLLPVCPEEGGVVGKTPVHAHMAPGAQYVFDTNPTREEHWAHRQRWPHTHCFVTEPYEGEVHVVPDLGLDTLWAYRAAGGALVKCAGAKLLPKQGPRHLVFHPTLRVAYVINELKSTVSVLRYRPEHVPSAEPAEEAEVAARCASTDSSAFLAHAQTLRTLPPDFESDDHHRSHASEIRIHPNGHWLLVANRGHDSIACYRVIQTDGEGSDDAGSDDSSECSEGGSAGLLELVHITPSGGSFPRNFNFDASGRFVIVGNQNSNNLTVFAFDGAEAGTGAMTMVDQKPQPSPNYIHCASLTGGSM